MEKTDCVAIYSLNDPRTNRPYYIGKTSHLKNRYHAHLNDASIRVHDWVQDLASVGCRPVMVLLEVVPRDRWKDAEKKWYDRYANDDMLLNHEVFIGMGGESPTVMTEEDVLASVGSELFIRDARENADPFSVVRFDVVAKLGMVRSLRSFRDREVAAKIKGAYSALSSIEKRAVAKFINEVIAAGQQ